MDFWAATLAIKGVNKALLHDDHYPALKKMSKAPRGQNGARECKKSGKRSVSCGSLRTDYLLRNEEA